MILNELVHKIKHLISVPTENSELLLAQYHAFSRQLPMMYFILVSSTWALVSTHISSAPTWLTIGLPVPLTIACALRIVYWWKGRKAVPTLETARYALSRTNHLASFFAIAFTIWSFMLFPYGDAYSRSHLAFYMAVTVISCVFSLMHLRSAAFIVAIIVNGAFVIFFSLTGQSAFIAMAVNMALVSIGMLAIINVNYRDFTRMINARTENHLKNLEQLRLLRMIDDMPVAVMTVEPDTLKINYANSTSIRLIAQIEHLLPIKADELIGTSIDVFHRHPEYQRRILADPSNLPHNARINLGSEVLDLKVSAVRSDKGDYLGPMLTWALVTKEVEAERRILQLAHYDILTGLANRITFHEQLKAALVSADKQTCLMYIDLDGFKFINDTKGHHTGDILLEKVAGRLRDVCSAPGITISRLGGDEFAIILPHAEIADAEAFATLIIQKLSAPYFLDEDRNVSISASIGIVSSPSHGSTGEILLARADMALYAAKAVGKGTFRVFSPDIERRIYERVLLESQLRKTLESEDGLFVFYQPITDIVTGKVTSREALIRWYYEDRGWVSPSEFIPVAEQSDLIDILGIFVLRQACTEAGEWKDGARVAVNVSAAQLGKGTISSAVMAALAESGLPPDRLEIEVTETALLNEEAGIIADLQCLRDLGVRVALDDFGTGYSSLAHLRMFTFDKIKIDGSFVKDAVVRPDCAAVVRAVADLGKRLGVTTVAEGVETQEQFDRILEEGCAEIQGYFYAPPAPCERDVITVERLNKLRAGSPAANTEHGSI
ncbi:putative bifunctional diguanylate cyclase/phosphodiesterase [Enterobacter sp. ECC-019]|uniref:putative bifunctional diguanylate cyclase/phosphodiesterase n=1 Tax=Enterobacter sp. ECC-019 TaxID=3116478 RepID=UPI003753F8BA